MIEQAKLIYVEKKSEQWLPGGWGRGQKIRKKEKEPLEVMGVFYIFIVMKVTQMYPWLKLYGWYLDITIYVKWTLKKNWMAGEE